MLSSIDLSNVLQSSSIIHSCQIWALQRVRAVPMDATTSGASSVQCHTITEPLVPPPVPQQREQRQCIGNESPGEFPLSANPSIVLHFLTSYHLDPQDLAKLEATCSFFRQPAQLAPHHGLSLAELAALETCQKRAVFKPMTAEEQQLLKDKCGGSWKLVLKYLLDGESCTRREKSQAIAGPGHSIAVASNGDVYSFGSNSAGQLGHGTTDDATSPSLIRSLQGIRIIHAAVGFGRTMLVSGGGSVYAFGKDAFGESEFTLQGNTFVTTPRLVESLKDVFVVQAAIGNFFTAVLSREGRVYTFSWGDEKKLCHQMDLNDIEPRPLLGPLENIPVVQVSAGYCYLLAMAFQPNGLSIYSVGCGLGGKLGHGCKTDGKLPRLIEHFATLNLQPVLMSAGAWHAAVVGKDGRVCTWGWGRHGCLGHGDEECQTTPKVVEALGNVQSVNVATGNYTTFVVSDTGHVYSFGCRESSNLGHDPPEGDEEGERNVLIPVVATSFEQVKERIVQISPTNSVYWKAHTLVLTESGKVYALGLSDKGQLGVELENEETRRAKPTLVGVDLS